MSQIKKNKPPVLREHEEEEILHHIIAKAQKNETVQREEVIEFVVKFLKSDNRKNPFRNGTPGDKWFSLFRRRHNKHFSNLEPEQLRIVERIGFTEKVMNTVVYKPNPMGKRQLPVLDSSWKPSTPKRKRKPKEFKEFVSSTPHEGRMSTSSVSQSRESSQVIVTSPTSDESSNVHTDDGEKSQESQGDSTDFQPGCKLEVMDFNDDKWYPVKVVEVDYEEGEILVHFEKWSNRYDEWVRMDSNRIRRPRLPSSNSSKKTFEENEKVIAVWAYNHKYPATVRKVLPNDKYEVLFCDGYAKILRGCKLFKATEEDLKNIKLPPPKKPAPPMGADPLDPDLGPKEERRLKKRRLDVYEALRPQKKSRFDNPETVDIKTEPRSASPSPTRTPTTSGAKPKESFRVVLKGRGGPPSEDDSEGEDDGWVEDNDDSDQEPGGEADTRRRRKMKKKVMFDTSDTKNYSRHGVDEDPERWNTEIPEGVVPVQIKDTEGYYRESIIIPDKKLPAGWSKHTMRRKTGSKWDVFLVNEDGRKFRSRNELRSFFSEKNVPFPEENFDFMVGRKMEMIRSQTDGRRKPIDSPGSTTKPEHKPVHKKSEKKAVPKNESTPDPKRVKTMLPKERNVDSGEKVKQEKPTPEASTPSLPISMAEYRTPDGGYTCCGKSFRKENLFQMHMKHYHPEYSNLFGSTPNVADLAYARTVGEPLEDSRAEAMTPRSTLAERVSKYEADRQKKAMEPDADSTPSSKIKPVKDATPVTKLEAEEAPEKLKEDEKKEKEKDSKEKPKEKIIEEEITKEEEKAPLKDDIEKQPEPVVEVPPSTATEDKKTEKEEDSEPTTSTKAKDPPEEKQPTPASPSPQTALPPPPPPPVSHTMPIIKPVIKPVKPVISKVGSSSEAVIVQTTSSPKTPVTITKYVPPGQSKPVSDSKPLKVTISSDKEGKSTIKTLLPVRPPPPPTPPTPATPTAPPAPPESAIATEPQKTKEAQKSKESQKPKEAQKTKDAQKPKELQKPKEVKIKEDSGDESSVPSVQTPKSRPRKRTVSEPLMKKPKLTKGATGSLEEEAAADAAQEPTPSTSAAAAGSGYRFSRNRASQPRVSLEKLSVTQDSAGRVVVASVEEKDKTEGGRRQFKKFKTSNNISKKTKGTRSGEEAAAKLEPVEETAATATAATTAAATAATTAATAATAAVAVDESDAAENLRKEEIINCTCGFTEEDGLMIQCDLCLCWQHGYCNNINKESEVPEKYVCYICLHPARQRESMRFRHNQDWLKEGKLPRFSFSKQDPAVVQQREDMLKKSHDLSASVLQLETVIHSLNVKTHIATMKQDHPKLYLWAKSWKDGSPEAKNESEEDGGGPRPEAAIDTKECRLRLLEHVEDYQIRLDDRLTSIDAQISALEAEDPELTSEVSEGRLKQTVQMLLKDLTTLQQVAALNT